MDRLLLTKEIKETLGLTELQKEHVGQCHIVCDDCSGLGWTNNSELDAEEICIKCKGTGLEL